MSVVGDAAHAGLRMACATAMPMGAYVADRLAGVTDEAFRFSFLLRCVSLGRRHGLVQRVDPHDAPRGAFGGRFAAWVKEAICRSTMLAMHLERRGLPYAWPRRATPLMTEGAA